MGFSRQEYRSGLPFPSPGDLLNPGIEPRSPALQADALSSEPPGKKCKSRKSRNIWSNGQIWPWITEWSRANTIRVLPREHTVHSKYPLPTTQEKTQHMDITRWSILKSDLLYLCSQRWRCSIQSAKARMGADCGSDHELLIAKFRLK